MTRGPDLGMLSETYGTVKRFFEWILVAVILVVTAVLIMSSVNSVRGDDRTPEPPKKLQALEKPGAADLPTSMKRAIECAETQARNRGTRMLRATVAPSDARPHQAYLVVCEFKDCSVGFWQGGSESETDQWVLVEKDQINIALDSLGRVPPK